MPLTVTVKLLLSVLSKVPVIRGVLLVVVCALTVGAEGPVWSITSSLEVESALVVTAASFVVVTATS